MKWRVERCLGGRSQTAEHYGKSPAGLGVEELRHYQVHLLQKRKLAPGTVEGRISALRFLYRKVLKRRDLTFDDLAFPKTPKKLPVVLSHEEVTQLIEAAPNLLYRTMLMILYGTGLRRAEVVRLKVDDIDSQRWPAHFAAHLCHASAGSRHGSAHHSASVRLRENMLISETLKDIKRTHGSAVARMAPILTDDLRLMLRCLPGKLLGIRDRALLLVGFVGAFRRSELVSLDVADLKFTSEGLLVTLRRSKTDQEGAGREVAIPHGAHESACPVRALQAWLTASSIEEGAVFRSMNRHGQIFPERLSNHSVALVVKRYAEKAGLDASALAGHSLRAGFVTSAARAGEPERRIMRQTGHRSVEMVLRYVRSASAFTDNAAIALGL